LSYAEINGTILAIIVAALTGYLLVVFEVRDRLITQVVDEANFMIEPGAAMQHDSGIEALTDAQRVQVLRALAHGHENPLAGTLQIAEDHHPERGRLLMRITERLLYHYPFRGATLTNVAEVRAWAEDLATAWGSVWTAYSEITKHRVRLLVAAADEAQDALILGAVKDEEMTPQIAESVEQGTKLNLKQFERQREYLQRLKEQRTTLARHLRQLDRYETRALPRGWLIVIGAAIAAGFVCGVAIPMVHPEITTVVSAWLPIGLYASGLAAVFIYLWRRPQA
jgi:hypothetical protein